jgi:GNAT superfamily N-acetyltransferase
MRIVRITAQNAWRLEHIERTPDASSWTREAEEFLFDGRALAQLRRPGTVMLAAEASSLPSIPGEVAKPARCVGAAVAFPDPVYRSTVRLGSLSIDHRFRHAGVGAALFGAFLTEALLVEPYAVWLVHGDNSPMLKLSRRHPRVRAEAISDNGYVQFFAE